jgi:antitoxin component YwqK of YwqJK toxin-antitoxin module
MQSKIYLSLITSAAIFIAACGTNEETTERKILNDAPPPESVKIDSIPPIMNGDYLVKYSNGVVKIRGEYKGGKRHGQWMLFFENGKMQSEGFYNMGVLDNRWITYRENGTIIYDGKYKNGNRIGIWKTFDETGKLTSETNYDKK